MAWGPGLLSRLRGLQPWERRWGGGGSASALAGVRMRSRAHCSFLFGALVLPSLSPSTTPRVPRPAFPSPVFSPTFLPLPKNPPADASLLAAPLPPPRPSHGRLPPWVTHSASPAGTPPAQPTPRRGPLASEPGRPRHARTHSSRRT